MASVAPRNDRGIIFYANGNGSGTYVDRFGQTRQIGTLDTGGFAAMAAAIETAILYDGMRQALTLEITLGFSGATSYDVRLVGRKGTDLAVDVPTPQWAKVQTVNEDTGASADFHNFTSGVRHILQTASGMSLGQARIEVKAYTGTSLTSSDFVIVSAEVA